MDTREVHFPTAGAATEKAPAPLAHQAVHDTVVNILQELSKGKLLDVPAGGGALAARLVAAGLQVQWCDLYPEVFGLATVEIRPGDLGGVLAYPDLSFDCVTWVGGR